MMSDHKNELFVAATSGDLDAVRCLLNPDSALNIYATNAADESLLVDVIRAEKPQVAHHLFDIYAADLLAVSRFFRSRRGDGYTLWRRQPILVACGESLCDAVTGLVGDAMRLPRVGCEQRRGLVVLLKPDRSNVVDGGCLWLSACSPADKRSIAKIIEMIYTANGGGVLDFRQSKDYNLLALSAHHRMPELFFRIQPHFGDPIAWDDYMPMLRRLLLITSEEGRDNNNATMDSLKALIDKLAMFRLDDLYAKENSWRLLETPIDLKLPDMFEQMLAEMVRFRGCPPSDILNELFQKSHLLSFDNICYARKLNEGAPVIFDESLSYTNRPIDFGPFVQIWIKYEADLLAMHSKRARWTPLKLICVQHRPISIPDQIVGDLLVRMNDTFSIRTRIDLVAGLIIDKRLPVLRRWFGEHPNVPTELDRDGYSFYVDIIRAIGGDDVDMAMAEFLFDSCVSLWDANTMLNFAICCAAHAAAHGMLRKLLALPQCKDVALDWDHWGNDRSPLMAALLNHCADNVQLLLDSVSDRAEIKHIKDFCNNDSLLAAAIWSPFDCRDIFESKALKDNDGSMYSNSSYAGALECPWPAHDFAKSAEQCTAEREQYDRFFDELLSAGCDMHHVNNDERTLIHFAVMCDHESILRRLLAVGLLEPSVADKSGCLPMHLVRSTAVFDVLLRAARQSRNADAVMAQRNAIGETPLACVSRYACTGGDNSMAHRRGAETLQLLDAMRAATTTDNALTNSRDGTTPLHCRHIHATIAKWLLANGADVNAASSDTGQTALHRQVGHLNMDVAEMLLAAPALNWQTVSDGRYDDGGISTLSVLVALSEEQFERVRPIVQSRPADIDRLFADQCNGHDILRTAIRSDTNAYCLARLLEHKERLRLDSVVFYGIRDAAALKLAMELCHERPFVHDDALLEEYMLSHALGIPNSDKMAPCADSVRTLIAAGIRMNEACIEHAVRHIDVNGYGKRRKTVVAIAAALFAAGAEYVSDDGAESPLRETALQCLLED